MEDNHSENITFRTGPASNLAAFIFLFIGGIALTVFAIVIALTANSTDEYIAIGMFGILGVFLIALASWEIYKFFKEKITLNERGVEYLFRNKNFFLPWEDIKVVGVAFYHRDSTPHIYFNTEDEVQTLLNGKKNNEKFIVLHFSDKIFQEMQKHWHGEFEDIRKKQVLTKSQAEKNYKRHTILAFVMIVLPTVPTLFLILHFSVLSGQTEGEVTRINRTESGALECVHVSFYANNEFFDDVCIGKPTGLKVGQTIPIIYNPNNPTNNTRKSFGNDNLVIPMMTGLWVANCVIMIVFLRRHKKRLEELKD